MGLTVKLTRRRSETFPPPYLFLFFVDLSDIFVFIFIFEYVLGWFLLTSGTRWHYHVQDGNRTHPPWFKGAWRDNDFMNDPPSLCFPSFLVSFTHFSANVSCVILFFLFSSVYPIFCVFLLQVNICFFCSPVCENEWIYSYTYVCLAGKKNQLMTTAASAVSIRNLDSMFALFKSSWPVAPECRDKMRGSRCGFQFQEEYFGLWGKNDPF